MGQSRNLYKGKTIRATWWQVLATLFSVILITGGSSLVLAKVQQQSLQKLSTRYQARLAILAEVNANLLASESAIKGVLYEEPGAATLDEVWLQYQDYSHAIDKDLKKIVAFTVDLPELGSTHADWASVKAAVAEAKGFWGTGEVFRQLAKGTDPFAMSAWVPLTDMEKTFSVAMAKSVAQQGEAEATILRNQATMVPVIIGGIFLVLVMSIYSVRLLSRRVITPLLTVRASVTRIHEGDLSTEPKIAPGAGKELQQLAHAMRGMTKSLIASQELLREKAYKDGLTGIANRRAFIEHLEQRLAMNALADTELLLIDLDGFKGVNDTMGHEAGDALLAEVGRRLSEVAGPPILVSRLGGDEFAVIIPTDLVDVAGEELAGDIIVRFMDELDFGGERLSVRCSIGSARGNEADTSINDLVRRADLAMYESKRQGKNRVSVSC
jgi:diguanylate cyclase (GGDEF)-like protein